jgi:hypothetical protein
MCGPLKLTSTGGLYVQAGNQACVCVPSANWMRISFEAQGK